VAVVGLQFMHRRGVFGGHALQLGVENKEGEQGRGTRKENKEEEQGRRTRKENKKVEQGRRTRKENKNVEGDECEMCAVCACIKRTPPLPFRCSPPAAMLPTTSSPPPVLLEVPSHVLPAPSHTPATPGGVPPEESSRPRPWSLAAVPAPSGTRFHGATVPFSNPDTLKH